MLRRLAARGRGSREDQGQRALLAFLQALRVVRGSGQPVFLAVRRATSRALLVALDSEADRGQTAPFDEQVGNGAPSPHADAPPFVACLAREVAERLVRRSGGEEAGRVIAGLETCGEQAARGHPPVTVARVRMRQHRVLRDLRGELGRR
jgi:hypothetical protein